MWLILCWRRPSQMVLGLIPGFPVAHIDNENYGKSIRTTEYLASLRIPRLKISLNSNENASIGVRKYSCTTASLLDRQVCLPASVGVSGGVACLGGKVSRSFCKVCVCPSGAVSLRVRIASAVEGFEFHFTMWHFCGKASSLLNLLKVFPRWLGQQISCAAISYYGHVQGTRPLWGDSVDNCFNQKTCSELIALQFPGI